VDAWIDIQTLLYNRQKGMWSPEAEEIFELKLKKLYEQSQIQAERKSRGSKKDFRG